MRFAAVTSTDAPLGVVSIVVAKISMLFSFIPAGINAPIVQTIVGALIGGAFFLIAKRLEFKWRRREIASQISKK
jgi:uncharacterized BrkB/YihY/UPF0761 family membrane protein